MSDAECLSYVDGSSVDDLALDAAIRIMEDNGRLVAVPQGRMEVEYEECRFPVSSVVIEGKGRLAFVAGTTGPMKDKDDAVTYVALRDIDTLGFKVLTGDRPFEYCTLVLKGNDEMELAIAAFRGIAQVLESSLSAKEKERHR